MLQNNRNDGACRFSLYGLFPTGSEALIMQLLHLVHSTPTFPWTCEKARGWCTQNKVSLFLALTTESVGFVKRPFPETLMR